MTLDENIFIYQEQKLALLATTNLIKKQLIATQTDQSIALMDRWATFCNSNEEFKEQEKTDMKAQSKGLQYVIDHYFTNEDMHNVILTKDLFLKCIKNGKIFPEFFNTYRKPLPVMTSFTLLPEAMEEILAKNIGSFLQLHPKQDDY